MTEFTFNTVVFLFILFSGAKAKVEVCIPNEFGIRNPTGNLESLLSDLKGELNSFIAPKAAEQNTDDSYYIGDLDINVTHPAVSLNGTLNNITLYGINKTKFCLLEGFDFTNLTKSFDLFEVMSSNLSFTGRYNITGNVAQLFGIFGHGDFWMHLYNFSMQALDVNPQEKEENSTQKICFPINVDMNLTKTECHFYGLMNDPELEDLFNKVIEKLTPEAVTVIWSEMKNADDQPLQKLIDQVIDKIFSEEQLEKMVNLIFKGGFSYPICHVPENFNTFS